MLSVILNGVLVKYDFNSFSYFMEKDQLQIEMGAYKIRQLHESEALLYKSMRLEAIQTEPAMFRCSTPAEADLKDAQWQERIKYSSFWPF
jgi:hypothetical protein